MLADLRGVTFIDKLNEIKHEITKLSSRASSLVTPWSAVRLLLPASWYKLATPRRRIAVADELGTQHYTKCSSATLPILLDRNPHHCRSFSCQ